MYQKICKKKSVQCFADFIIAVVGHEIKRVVFNSYASVWSKIHENWKEYSIQIILDRKRFLPLSRKIQTMTHPLSCFFAAEGPRFNLGAYWVVKPLKFVFYDLKGRGPIKKVKNLRECWQIKGPSIDTTQTPPLFSFYTTFKGIDQPFGRGVESILIRSALVNWRLGGIYLILKGLHHKIDKKPYDAA